MSEEEKAAKQKHEGDLERRGFFYILFGGAIAAVAGWIAGIFPRTETDEKDEVNSSSAEARISALETGMPKPTAEVISSSAEGRISALEAKVAQQTNELMRISEIPPIAQLQGGNELVVFDKKELSIQQQKSSAVFLNLVNHDGGVGIRFFKDFGFDENPQVKSPWSIWIEGVRGYQGLAILRDWRFTAALWDEDGKLLLGRLDSYPPGNQPARARFDVRGTTNEIQAIVEASSNQTADIFQVTGGDGTRHFAVNGAGDVVIGSPDKPKAVIMHDTIDGSAYSLQVTNGQLILTKA